MGDELRLNFLGDTEQYLETLQCHSRDLRTL